MIFNSSFIFSYLFPVNLTHVHLIYDANMNFSIPEEFMEQARLSWKNVNKARLSRGLPSLEPHALYRPGSLSINSHGINIFAGITTFFDNFFLENSNSYNTQILTGAGLSVIPVCQDHEILIGRRNKMVSSHIDLFHVAGGHAHPSGSFINKPDTLHKWVYAELLEEMWIEQNDVSRLTFLGMAVDLQKHKPEWLIRADLNQTSSYYIDRWKEKKTVNSEFSELSHVNKELIKRKGDKINIVMDRLSDLSHLFTPACQAAISAHLICL